MDEEHGMSVEEFLSWEAYFRLNHQLELEAAEKAKSPGKAPKRGARKR